MIEATEVKDINNGTVILGIDYYTDLVNELNSCKATMHLLANILEVTHIPRKNIIKILREDYRNVFR